MAEDLRRNARDLVDPVYGKLSDHLHYVRRNEIVSPMEYLLKRMETHEKQKNDHSTPG